MRSRKKTTNMMGAWQMRKKLWRHQTLQDKRTSASGGSKSVRTPENIAAVREHLSDEENRNPDELRSSSRRNDLNLTKSTFSRITKYDLKLHPYKLLRLQKATPHHAQIADEETAAQKNQGLVWQPLF